MMKWMGAILIILACGTLGFSMAASFRREERALRQILGALDYMQCELQYHLTPLPDLCAMAGKEYVPGIGKVLLQLSAELESQITPDVASCMHAALVTAGELPAKAEEAFRLMGTSLGRFDMEGQVRGLDLVRQFCRRELDAMALNRDQRLRSYQTLGLCAGAALAILFV